MSDDRRGATIIELLIVVGILGLISTIAIWNYFIAVERAKSKRSVADMRSIGTAWESRETDLGRYNAAGLLFTWPPPDRHSRRCDDQSLPYLDSLRAEARRAGIS